MARFIAAAALALGAAAGATQPHIISILQDDLGFYDSGIHNPAAANWTANVTALARDGIVLLRHYTHWHCSPSRRTFLTGRLPIHHGEQLSANDGDDIDLRMTWVSEKLRSVGYRTAMFGKWHTGFRSFAHLPASRGFDVSVGSLQTGGTYEGPLHTTRWQNDHPIWSDAQWDGGTLPDDANTDDTAAPPRRPCDAYARPPARCDADATWLRDTEVPCGALVRYTNATSAGDCCADCADEPSCTHWVFKGAGAAEPCHVKAGDNDCAQNASGSTSGLAAASATACTDEYSTDLWGSLATRVVDEHSAVAPGRPLFAHLCFEAVHTPYDPVPANPFGGADGDNAANVYAAMLWRADVHVGALVASLRAAGLCDDARSAEPTRGGYASSR